MQLVTTWAFLTVVGVAAYFDLRYRRIPNILTASGLGLALALRGAQGLDPFVSGLIGAALAALVAVPLFALRAFGGGDGKLLIAVGGFLGGAMLPGALLLIAIIGGVIALVDAFRRRVLLPVLYNTADLMKRMVTLGRAGHRPELSAPGAVTIPYGVAISLGAALWWFWGSTLV